LFLVFFWDTVEVHDWLIAVSISSLDLGVKNSDYLDVYYSLLEEIKKRFDQEGIAIPYPQTDVHIHNHTE
jgi:Small-conductance mechanosensitive channel